MRIILSRKGLDSGNSRMPSPVMPDGSLLSLPIPRGKGYCHSYSKLVFKGRPLSEIIKELNKGTLPFDDYAHADPDLDRDRLSRKFGWRPIFGQTGGDQTHLENQGVGVGDLFLFFGWFRRTEVTSDGKLRFIGSPNGFHAIFGWLQVGQKHNVCGKSVKSLPEWALDHPHVATPDDFHCNNTIYISTEKLTLGGSELPILGAGTFPSYNHALRLSAPDGPRSLWVLPEWFYPDGKPPLSYHSNQRRWSSDGQHAFLQSVARGQEFVLNTKDYPAAESWIVSLFDASMRGSSYPSAAPVDKINETVLDYRNDARKYLKRCEEELGAGDNKRLKYAALELRMAMEALTYDRALAYKDEFPPAEYETWQPRKVMLVLLDIDPTADKDSTISGGIEEVEGVPAPIMALLGTEKVLNMATLRKHYDALSSFLHIPSMKQSREGKIQDLQRLRNRCEEIAASVRDVLSSPVFNAIFGNFATVDCIVCGKRIRKRLPQDESGLRAECFECGASYTIVDKGNGEVEWQPRQQELECGNADCRQKVCVWQHEIEAGRHWVCEGCGGQNRFALGIRYMAQDRT